MKSKLLIIINSYNKVLKPQTVLICNKDAEAMKGAFEEKFEVHCEENVQTEADTRGGTSARKALYPWKDLCAEEPLHFFVFSGHGHQPGYRETEGDFINTYNGKVKILVKEITQKICKITARHKGKGIMSTSKSEKEKDGMNEKGDPEAFISAKETLEKWKSVAVSGQSGSGKSSFINTIRGISDNKYRHCTNQGEAHLIV